MFLPDPENHVNGYNTWQQYKNNDTQIVKVLISVSANYIWFIHYNPVKKTTSSLLLRLKFVEWGHEQWILGVAFIAWLDCTLLLLYQMCHKNGIIDLSMTFDAPYVFKMSFLVRQPVMGLQNIYFFPVRKQLKPIIVRVAIQTDIIIIKDCLLEVFTVADAYPVLVRIMAFPAWETPFLKLTVHTLLIFSLYCFKIKPGKLFIPPMAVDAVIT